MGTNVLETNFCSRANPPQQLACPGPHSVKEHKDSEIRQKRLLSQEHPGAEREAGVQGVKRETALLAKRCLFALV